MMLIYVNANTGHAMSPGYPAPEAIPAAGDRVAFVDTDGQRWWTVRYLRLVYHGDQQRRVEAWIEPMEG